MPTVARLRAAIGVDGFADYERDIRNAEKLAQSYGKEAEKQGKLVTEANRASEKAANDLKKANENLAKSQRDTSVATTKLTAVIAAQETTLDQAAAVYERMVKGAEDLTVKEVALAKAYEGVAKAGIAQTQALEGVQQANDKATKASQNRTAALEREAGAWREQATAMGEVVTLTEESENIKTNAVINGVDARITAEKNGYDAAASFRAAFLADISGFLDAEIGLIEKEKTREIELEEGTRAKRSAMYLQMGEEDAAYWDARIRNGVEATAKIAMAEKEAIASAVLAEKEAAAKITAIREAASKNRLAGSVSSISGAASSLRHFGTSASFAVSAPVAGLDILSTQAYEKMDRYTNLLNHITHDASETDKVMKELVKDAGLPGVEFDSLVRGVGQLGNAKVPIEQARHELVELGNEIRNNGKTLEDYNRIVDDFVQLQGLDRVSTQKVRQIVRIMPDFNQFLNAAYGTSNPKAVGDMGVSGKQLTQDWTNWASQQQRAIHSVEDTVDDLRRQLFLIGADFGKALVPVEEELGKVLVSDLQAIDEWFKTLDDDTKKNIVNFTLLAAAVGPVAYAFSQILSVGAGALRFLGMILVTGQKLQAVFQIVAAGAGTFGEALALVFSPLVAELLPVAAAIAAVAAVVWVAKAAYDHFNPSVQDANKALLEQSQIKLDHAQNAVAVGELAKKYLDLQVSTLPVQQIQENQQKIIQELIKINPDFIDGLDQQGKYHANLNKIIEAGNTLLQKRKDLNKASLDDLNVRLGTIKTDRQSTWDAINKTNYDLQTAQYYKAGSYDKNRRDSNGYLLNQNAFEFNMAKAHVDSDNVIPDLVKQLGQLQAHLTELNNQQLDVYKSLREYREGTDSATKSVNNFASTVGANKLAEAQAKEWKSDAKKAAADYGLKVVSEYRPGAVTRGTGAPSEHGMSIGNVHGLAIDFSGTKAQMAAFFNMMKTQYASHIKEMLYSPLGEVINGQYRDHITNDKTRADHFDHLHLSLNSPLGDTSGALQSSIAFKQQQKEAAKDARDAMSEQKKAQDDLDRTVDEIKQKQIDLRAALAKTNDMTGAQALAVEFATDNLKKYGAVVPRIVLAEQARTIELQKQVDLHEQLLDAQAKIAEQALKNKVDSLDPRKQVVVNAFGAKDWFKLSNLVNQADQLGPVGPVANPNTYSTMLAGQAARNAQNQFSKGVLSGKDTDFGKDAATKIKEYNDSLAALYTTVDAFPETEASKAQNWVNKFTDDAKKAGDVITPDIKKQLDKVLQAGTDADKRNYDLQYKTQLTDIQKYARDLQGTLGGLNDVEEKETDRANARILDFLAVLQKKGILVTKDIQDAIDAAKKAAGQIDAIKFNSPFAKELAENALTRGTLNASPYETWLSQQKRWNGKEMVLPNNLQGKDLTAAFNDQQLTKFDVELRKIKDDSIKTAAEMTAANPYQAWLVSMMQVDHSTNTMHLPVGVNEADLKRVFDYQQKLGQIRSLADGLRGIFDNVINDIQNKGFHGLWANIYDGFQQLLFKMAVEYLESQLYQLLLSGLSHAFGVAAPTTSGSTATARANGGPVGAFSSYIVGEHGKELFIPSQPGYIFSASNLTKSLGASASMGTYSGNNYGNNTYNNASSADRNVVIHQTINNHYYGSGTDSQRAPGRQESQDALRSAQRLQQRRG